jgi:hypothetical protein
MGAPPLSFSCSVSPTLSTSAIIPHPPTDVCGLTHRSPPPPTTVAALRYDPTLLRLYITIPPYLGSTLQSHPPSALMPLSNWERFAAKNGQGKHPPPRFSPIVYGILRNLPPWLQVFFTRNGPNADQLLACVCNQGYTHTINPKLLSAVMRVLGPGPLSQGHLVTLTTSAALCAKNTSLIPITDDMRREMREDLKVSKKESGSARRGGRDGWRTRS